MKLGINFEVLPRLPFADGIEAVRNILNKCWFDEEKTQTLVKALMSFRKEWDEKLGKFKDTPLKDWASDPADAFRMMAIAHRDHIRLGEYDAEEEELRKIHEKEQELKNFDPLNPFGI